MRTIFNFPVFSHLIFLLPKTPKDFSLFSSQIQSNPLSIPIPMAPSTRIVAEYAKSSRSSCKKCSKTIDAKSLRLGSISREARGFDITKWHHPACFSFASESLASAQEIAGFDSLKVFWIWVFQAFINFDVTLK